MGKVLKIEFTYDGRYETETENIGQGILIIPTMDGEYVLINFTVDGALWVRSIYFNRMIQ